MTDFIGFLDDVYTKMEAPFEQLLDCLEEPVACVVADTFLPWMVAIGSRRNIPVSLLWTKAPSIFSIYYHFELLASHGHFPDQDLPERGEEIIDYLPGVSPMRLADLPSTAIGKTSTLKPVLEAFSFISRAQSILFTSFFELQPHVIDTLRTKLPIPIYTIGPSIPYLSLVVPPSNPNPSIEEPCFVWLNSQPHSSVLFVSLGSFPSSKEQRWEFAKGLKASGVRYLWVVQDEDSELQAESGKRGQVVPRCDRFRVLCHPAVVGFLTDCWWDSTMESIYAATPMLTFPSFADQIHNNKIIVEDLGVGVRLRKVGMDNVVGGDEIALAVENFVDLNGNAGKEVRERAKELQSKCKRAIEEGGSTYTNADAFIRNFVKGIYA
ncbi:Trans-zeatin O-beta-D-glucosyltransferase [Bertholletia excelsa]